MPLVHVDDPPRTRAEFIDYNLWVTRHDPGEVYAARRFPNQWGAVKSNESLGE